MDVADVPAVLALQAQCYGEDYVESAAAFEAKLRAAAGLNTCWVAWQGDEALAYVVSLPACELSLPALDARQVQRSPAPSMLYLHDLAVSPKGRQLGLGRALIEQVVRRAQDLGLPQIALIAVQGSEPYWTRHGFARWRRYSEHLAHKLASFGAGASLMRLALL